MNSIRFRVSLMLVCSVLCVVILASAVMSKLVIDVVDQNFRDGLSGRVSAFANSITFEGNDAIFHLQPAPVEGKTLEEPTVLIKDSFRKARSSFDAFVKQTPDGRRWVSIKMGPGWLSWPVPDHTPPPTVWYGLAGWMALITAGVIGVALLSKRRDLPKSRRPLGH